MQHRQIAWLAAVVYFIQGAIGISAIAVPIYFRKLGWSISEITVISSITSLPWIFKVVYGFLSDSFPIVGQRRKSYLLIYLLCSILGWCAFAFWGTTQTQVVIALWIANLGFAGTDVITDGLIVENSEGEWSSLYQSIAWGARGLGSVLTGILGGWLVLHLESKVIFLITAFLPLLAIFPLIRFKETLCESSFSKTVLTYKLKTVWTFCAIPQNGFFAVFLALSTSSVLFGTPFFFYLKENLFFKEDYLGFLISLGWAGAAIGSIVFGLRMKKIPLKNLFYAVVILNTLNVLSAFLVRDVDSALWLTFFGGIAAGMMLLPLMTAAAVMTSQSGVEGTLFALLMGLYNLAQIGWGILGGKLFPYFGMWGLVALATAIQLAAYFLISRIDFKKLQNVSSVG